MNQNMSIIILYMEEEEDVVFGPGGVGVTFKRCCRSWGIKIESLARKNASNNQNLPLFAVLRLISKKSRTEDTKSEASV